MTQTSPDPTLDSVPAARTLRLALRGSRLSIVQAEQAVALLRQRWPALRVELLTVTTRGDRDRETPLAEIDSPDGIFTRGVEAELLAGRAEVAVHSLKDLPTATDPALVLATFPPRADARDALVSRHAAGFDGLPHGATLGTSSPRRAAQALALRPDLRVVSVRGNVDTRLRKLREGQVDALLLAAAGLERLGLLDEAAELLPIDRFTPAVGQGALAVQCRAEDEPTRRLLAAIDDPPTRAAVTAERTFLRALGGGCRLPLSAYGQVNGDRLSLRGFIATPDGREAHADALEGSADEPELLGRELAERLRSRVAPELLAEVRGG